MKRLPVLLATLLWCLCAYAQERTTTGQVMDANNHPIAGVTVTVKGKNVGTSTNENGTFTLKTAPGDVLVFTSIGYTALEQRATAKMTLTLQSLTASLGDVVVVGYGTQRQKEITGSTVAIKAESLPKTANSSINNLLQGQAAGLNVDQRTAQPGGGLNINIRGQGYPLYVIDGVPLFNNQAAEPAITSGGSSNELGFSGGIDRDPLENINPNDIESIEILKDASATAIYGSAAANGVILITTKRGKATGTANLSVNSYYGFQRPTFPPKMLNAKDYMTLKNEGDVNSGLQPEFAQSLINNYDQLHAQNPDLYPNSNAQKEMVQLNTPVQNYNVQVSGGNDKIQYYVGLNYFGQQGNVAPLYYNRYSYNAALDINATSTTKISVSLSGAEERNQIYPSIAGSFISYIPTAAIYYTNGLWGQSGGYSPAGALNSGSYDRVATSTLLTSVGVEQQLPFIKGLSIKGVFSYDPVTSFEKVWNRPTYYYNYDTTTTPPSYDQNLLSDGYTTLTEYYNKNENFTYQGYLNYHRDFGKNAVTGLIVAEARNNIGNSFDASRKGFSVDVDQLSLGTSDRQNFSNDGTGNTGSQLGYVYRLNYGFANKYLFEATGRYDGHYYFAPGKRWAYFPAFSAGWRLSEEHFIKDNLPWVNDLKIRGSWGKSGNLAGLPFQYLSSYTLYGNAYVFGNNSLVQGSYVGLEANPNITWERANKSDVGLEGTFLKGLVTFEGDYFYEKRSNMLLAPAITVPVEYGLSLAEENAGIMSNHGVEFTVGSKHVFHNGLILGLNGNFSYAKNKLLQVFETAATRDNPNRSRTGRAYGTPFGYKAIGLFKTTDDKNGDGNIDAADGYNVTQFGTLHPGDVKYADLNHDGVIDANDETAVGYPVTPQITYGFTLAARWKGFDLSLFFQGAAESSLNIQGYQTVPFRINNTNTSYEYFDNRWTPDHQDARYPKAYASKNTNNTTNPLNGDGFGPMSSSEWMINTGFLRLKTGVLGYTIPQRMTKHAGMQTVRFYVSAQNWFTFSKLKFMDPETGYNDREEAYPIQKTVIFGINVNF